MADPRVQKTMDSMGDAFASTIERNRAEREAAREGSPTPPPIEPIAEEAPAEATPTPPTGDLWTHLHSLKSESPEALAARYGLTPQDLTIAEKVFSAFMPKSWRRGSALKIAEAKRQTTAPVASGSRGGMKPPRKADDVLKDKRRDATTVPEGY